MRFADINEPTDEAAWEIYLAGVELSFLGSILLLQVGHVIDFIFSLRIRFSFLCFAFSDLRSSISAFFFFLAFLAASLFFY